MTRFWPCAAASASLFAVALAAQLRGPLHAADRGDPGLPERLADTGLYEARGGTLSNGVRAFSPQYPLWSDGLVKRRWIKLPPNGAIDGTEDDAWEFPAGTRFWKEFSLGSRKVETRVLVKVSGGGWRYGSYVWNDAGTEAVLAPAEGVITSVELAPGRPHVIPSRTDCAACHGPQERGGPLGFNALQLSPDRDPEAIHGEPLQEGMLTLEVLSEEGRLRRRPGTDEPPPRIRTQDPSTRALLGYLAANCSHCHNGNGDIAALAPVIRYADLLRDGDAVARSLLGVATAWQLPRVPDGSTLLVSPGAPERSALFARMKSRSPSMQMPPLGTVLRDQQAVDALSRWIAGASAHPR